MTENNSHWFAIITKPRWEKKIAKRLEDKGFEYYCPLNKVLKQWSDRKKIVLEPLFKSYVFVKVTPEKKWDIKKIPGIINYVYWQGKPAQIRESEIITIKKFLNEFENIKVEDQNILLKGKVRIKQGVLMNYEGILLELSGNRAIVKIESMGIQLSAHFNKSNLEVLL